MEASMEAPIPDLSHLTEQERKIIEKVMARQKEEESKEKEVFKKKQDEVMLLETAIKLRSQEQRKDGNETDLQATCRICLKTKFADGVGHVCHYCGTRCCARCGGKVSLRSNKVIWLCILCRKRQELLIKTGQWVQTGSRLSKSHSGLPTYDLDSPMLTPRLDRARSLDKESTHPPMLSSPTSSRRDSLQRQSPSGTPREFRRQLSHEACLETRHYYDAQSLSECRSLGEPIGMRSPRDPRDSSRDRSRHGSRDPSPEIRSRRSRDHTPGRDHSVDRHRDRRNCWDPRDRYRDSSRDNDGARSRDPSRERRDSSRDRCRRDHSRNRSVERKDSDSRRYRSPSSTRTSRTPVDEERGRSPHRHHHQHLDPNSALHTWSQNEGSGSRRSSDAIVRNDSLSSDQSENVRPPPPKHRSKRNRKQRQRSFSSSEDEVRSTPEYSSAEEMESESISEKGEPGSYRRDRNVDDPGIHGSHDSAKSTHGSGSYNPGPDYLPKKTVRFHRANPQEPPWKDIGLPEQHSKDSGIDTSSSATLNEETNNKHPVTWKVSVDGTKLIGHILLKKGPSQDGFGLKVVGGKIMDSGRLGAVVEETRPGGLAETVGHIKQGDIVLEWNGRSLQDKTYDEVHKIINLAKEETQLEIILHRPISNIPQHEVYDKGNRRAPYLEVHPQAMTREGNPRYGQHSHTDRRPSVTVTSPQSPDQVSNIRLRSPTVGGRIQVKLWYDAKHLQLVVTIVCAVNLPLRPNFQPRNPYVKIVMTPDRREKSCKRRTKTIANTNEPKWNQTFVFSPLRRADLHSRRLEISMWDYDRYSANDFLGEVIIDLGMSPLDGLSEWYLLTTHEENLAPSQLSRQPLFRDTDVSGSLTSNERMSPPSTTSRLSDSELSEGDFEDRFSAQTERRMMAIDGASFSSLGSSSSSPFLPSEAKDERRSRRDIDLTDTRSVHKMVPDAPESEVMYGRSRRESVESSETRGRSRSVAPGDGMRHRSSHRSQEFSSRSLSPPELRGHPMGSYIPSHQSIRSFQHPRTSNSTSTTRKRQLPQVPYPPSWRNPDTDDRVRQTNVKYSTRRSGSISRGFPSDVETVSRNENFDRRYSASYGTQRLAHEPGMSRRGGGSRMAAALGVGASPMVSPEVGSDSETSSITKYSINSAFETQLHKNSRTVSDFTTRVLGYSPVHPSRSAPKEKVDGSLSDTAIGTLTDKASRMGDGSRPSSGSGSYGSGTKMPHFMGGLSKKSSSTSQLSVTGYKKRFGFNRKQTTTLVVQRSEEILPDDVQLVMKSVPSSISSDGEGSLSGSDSLTLYSNLSSGLSQRCCHSCEGCSGGGGFVAGRKSLSICGLQDNEEPYIPLQSSSSSLLIHQGARSSRGSTDSSIHSIGRSSPSVWISALRMPQDGEIDRFTGDLGPGQFVGRQALASPALGEVQLSLCERKCNLEVEVIRARGLLPRLGTKILPAPYVKLYLMNGHKCIAKAKTPAARRTLDPLYQQQLVFAENFGNCVLQVTVWGEYSRLDKKVFMGAAQIMLDEMDLSHGSIGWYKLFHQSTLVSIPTSSGSTRNSVLSLNSYG